MYYINNFAIVLQAAPVFMQSLAKENWASLKRMASEQVYTAQVLLSPFAVELSHVRCCAGDRRLQNAYRTRRRDAPADVGHARRGVAVEVRTTGPQVHAQRAGGGPLLAPHYRPAIHQQRGHFCWHANCLADMRTSTVHVYVLRSVHQVKSKDCVLFVSFVYLLVH